MWLHTVAAAVECSDYYKGCLILLGMGEMRARMRQFVVLELEDELQDCIGILCENVCNNTTVEKGEEFLACLNLFQSVLSETALLWPHSRWSYPQQQCDEMLARDGKQRKQSIFTSNLTKLGEVCKQEKIEGG